MLGSLKSYMAPDAPEKHDGPMQIVVIPRGFDCKLTGALLQDPILAEDGYTYERAAWEQHVASNTGKALISPQTGAPMSAVAVPSRHLKTAAHEFNLHTTAVPPRSTPFDLEKWAEDPITHDSMQEPVRLPDGMVCDLATARDHIFHNSQHPGRSLLDQRMTFTPEQTLLRDINTLEISEAAQNLPFERMRRDYPVPTIAALLGLRAPASARDTVADIEMQAPVPHEVGAQHAAVERAVAPQERGAGVRSCCANVAMAGAATGRDCGVVIGSAVMVGAFAGLLLGPAGLGVAMILGALGEQHVKTQHFMGYSLVALTPVWIIIVLNCFQRR